MQLDDVNVYLQIVSNGSLSRAAKAMRRPKASVSHQLKRLEDELGTELFQRSPNQLTLNEAGQDFYEHALSIRRACERAIDTAKGSRERLGGKLNIASASELTSNLVSPVLLHFTRHHAELEVSVMMYQRETLAEVREQYDCILYLGEPPLPQFSNMSARLLGRFRFALYASDRYLQNRGAPKHPKDLLSFDLLGFHDGQTIAPWHMSDGRGEFSVRPETTLVSNDLWVIKLSAIHDHGIAFMPTFFAGLEERAGLLKRVLPQWASAEIPVYALFWSHRFANPNLRALIDAVAKNFDEIHSYLYTAARNDDLRAASEPAPPARPQ